MKHSNIEWTDHTFNAWLGCTRVSPGCDDCYAARSTPVRTMGVVWGPGEPRKRTSAGNWKAPVTWNKLEWAQCGSCGWRGDKREARLEDGAGVVACPACHHGQLQPARARVFCSSLADVFDNEVPPEWRVDLLALVRRTSNLDWLLLTKRIGNVGRLLEDAAHLAATQPDRWPGLAAWLVDWAFNGKPPANVWLGATIVNQEEADRDIPKLLATPAAVRFLSMEPLLGAVDLAAAGGVRYELGNPDPIGRIINQREAYPGGDPDGQIDWVIVGGESGPRARPMQLQWVRDLQAQCKAAGVPFLFKQWGEYLPAVLDAKPDEVEPWRTDQAGRRWWDLLEAQRPRDRWEPVTVCKPGKKVAGRLLDGQLHDGYPR